MPAKKKGTTHRVETGGTTGARGSRSVGTGRGLTVVDGQTKVDPAEELGHVEGVIGLEHKPYYSEAVLRATGLHGGPVGDDPEDLDEDDDDKLAAKEESRSSNARARTLHAAYRETPRAAAARSAGDEGEDDDTPIRDLRDLPGAIFIPPPDLPEDCLEVHQVVNYLQHAYGGLVERTTTPKRGRVTTRLTYGEDAEVVSGSGMTTKDALRQMCDRLGENNFPALATTGGK